MHDTFTSFGPVETNMPPVRLQVPDPIATVSWTRAFKSTAAEQRRR